MSAVEKHKLGEGAEEVLGCWDVGGVAICRGLYEKSCLIWWHLSRLEALEGVRVLDLRESSAKALKQEGAWPDLFRKQQGVGWREIKDEVRMVEALADHAGSVWWAQWIWI